MTDDLATREPPKILVPIEVLEGQTLPETLVDLLAPADVVILGYHVLPEQTPTEQASMQFEERARAAVEDIAHPFGETGRTVETRVAFTHDRDETVGRVAIEIGATAVLLANAVGEIADVLVAVRGAIDTDRLVDLVATLVGSGTQRVTVAGITTDTAASDAAAAVETARETLFDRGFDPARLTTETVGSERPVADIVDRSDEFDAVVMGQREETPWSVLLGGEPERVAAGAVAPVLIVRERGDGTA